MKKILHTLGDFFKKPYVSVEDALLILGKDNVILPDETGKVLETEFKPGFKPTYQREILEFFAKENGDGQEWNLVFRSETSASNLRKKFPGDFFATTIWDGAPKWLDEEAAPGYRLINFKPVPLKELPQRKAFLTAEGIVTAPAKISTLAEALIILKNVRSKYLLVSEYHCSDPIAKSDEVFVIGGYSKHGMMIYSLPACLPSLSVVLCVVPQLGWLRTKPPTT